MQTETTAAELKQREHKTWTGVAPGWRAHVAYLVGATTPVTERMLSLLRLAPGMRVLDIACGTGEPAIPAAQRVGPGGRVIATDFVEEMLATAREKAARQNVRNVEFRRVDGEQLDFPSDSFDAVSIRWGLMFMPEPLQCLQEAHRVLKRGARLAVACWAEPEKNRWASMPMAIIRRRLNLAPPPPGTPGLFAFADQGRLRMVIESAGFRNCSVEPIQVTMADFDTGKEFFTMVRDLAGPIATLFAQLSGDQQREVSAEIAREGTGPDERSVITGVTWVASGEK